MLSEDACPLLSQEFYGDFKDIQLEEVKVVKTLMGSVVNLFQKLTFQKCEPIYFGTVEHPKPEKDSSIMKVLE